MSDRRGLAAAAGNKLPARSDDGPAVAASPTPAAPAQTSMRTIIQTMWPADGGAGTTAFHLLPRGDDPTLAVPVRPRRVAAAALRRYKTPSSSRDRLRMQTIALGVRVGLAPRLLRWPQVTVADRTRSATLLGHLEQQLGERMYAAIAIGPPRQNRKPIVQLLSDDGRTIAFAKVGVSDVTRDLVRRESAALQQVSSGSVPSLVVPEVLHSGAWRDLEVVVLSALPPASGERVSPARRLAAMQEVASVAGRRDAAYGSCSYRARLMAELDRPGPLADRLRTVAAQLDSSAADQTISFGAWHGDWAPWNMAAHEGRVMLWDWERFETDAPAGFDALHFELQKLIRVDGLAPRVAVAELCRGGADLLRPFDGPVESAELVVALYLTHIGARALHHERDAATTRRGPIDHWLLPGLEDHVQARTGSQPGPTR
jgi:hypothetical protein